jgi:hypothetical protein
MGPCHQVATTGPAEPSEVHPALAARLAPVASQGQVAQPAVEESSELAAFSAEPSVSAAPSLSAAPLAW